MEINLVKKNGGQCNFLCLIGQLEEKKSPYLTQLQEISRIIKRKTPLVRGEEMSLSQNTGSQKQCSPKQIEIFGSTDCTF